MKKTISLLLILILIFTTAGCDSLTEFKTTGGSSHPIQDQTGGTNTSGTAEDSEALANDPTAFTVALRLDDVQYTPKKSDNVIAQWTDGFSFHTAEFGDDGYARIKGLDGDFTVTLKNLPDTFVYNPNIYVAKNEAGYRSVVIDIYRPIKTTGLGTDAYECVNVKELGVYKATINGVGKDYAVYFEYAPTVEGTYAIESWMSTSESEYDPNAVIYTSNFAYKVPLYTVYDGGYSEGYTKNFNYKVEIAKENISDDGMSSAVFTFAVYVESKGDNFPVNVDFAITRNGSFSLDHYDKELIIPDMPLEQMPEYSSDEYTWKWAETDSQGAEGRYEFDGSMFKLWAKEDGGDGYYHLYDKKTETYGAILYAKISEPHRFSASFTTIEYSGNAALTVNGTQNYKLMIEGIAALIDDPGMIDPQFGGSYFCLRECPCRVDSCTGVCGESCMNCLPGCRNLPDVVVETMIAGPFYCSDSCTCGGAWCESGCENCTDECKTVDLGAVEGMTEIVDVNGNAMFVDNLLLGLQEFTNSDGVYAVTAQIKDFLQGISITQRYFADGDGWIEINSNVYASEDDQWLFACGYYEKIT